ncbi:MAG: zinc ribbon domain-containing protein [Candidatus Marinimicrobia bacterium]|nr:zinc ribbon domain-containing protein [Candidatus Neomarinimicrobiota bacterium]
MMDAVAPLLLFVLFSGTIFYVFVPFLGPVILATGDESATKSLALELRKISLYKQLREVEFEQKMGLVDDHDFARVRTDLMEEVAGVIEAAEAASGESTGQPAVAGAVAEAAETCPSCSAETEPEGRFCSQCGTELGAGCPGCGARVEPHDQFCGRCGRGLVSSS